MERGNGLINLTFDSVGSEDAEGVSGQKPPIILLHGCTNSKETWKKLMHPLAKATGRKVYAFDARNHGDSSWSDDLSYDLMRDDLYTFLEGIRAPKAVLIGHSMGGKAAMYFALKWPDKVEKLVIEDISIKAASTKSQAQKYVQLLQRILNLIPENVTDLSEAKEYLNKQLVTMMMEDDPNKSDSSLLPLTQNINGVFRWKANLSVIDSKFFNHTLPEVKGTFKGPALFLWGTKSPYKVTNDRDYILQYFPGARFRAVEGASHLIHQFHEEVFFEEVSHFVNDARSRF